MSKKLSIILVIILFSAIGYNSCSHAMEEAEQVLNRMAQVKILPKEDNVLHW